MGISTHSGDFLPATHVLSAEMLQQDQPQQLNPWDLLTSTRTYQELVAGLPVSKNRYDFLMAAAGLSEEEAATYHGWAIRGLPGAKYHAMNGQLENSNIVRQNRAAARDYREFVVLQNPEHYKFALMR